MKNRLRAVILVSVSLLIPMVPFLLVGELPGERWLSSADGDSLRFGAFGAALLAGDVLLPVPSSVVGALLGARLGFGAGWAWGWSGLCLGNLFGYAAGRFFALRADVRLPSAPTVLLFFASRPVPVLAEALCLVAGTNRIPLPSFLLATAIGNAAYMAALAGSGAAFIPGSAASPALAVPMLLPLLAWCTWRISRRRHHRLERRPIDPEAPTCST